MIVYVEKMNPSEALDKATEAVMKEYGNPIGEESLSRWISFFGLVAVGIGIINSFYKRAVQTTTEVLPPPDPAYATCCLCPIKNWFFFLLEKYEEHPVVAGFIIISFIGIGVSLRIYLAIEQNKKIRRKIVNFLYEIIKEQNKTFDVLTQEMIRAQWIL